MTLPAGPHRQGLRASGFSARDIAAEALAGMLQRPGRSALTMFGTVLGIGTFVAVLGLSATANGQISKQFSILQSTQVTVTDVGAQNAASPVDDFPARADADADRIQGVIAAGAWWQVALPDDVVARTLGASQLSSLDLPVYAATPGILQASQARLATGAPLNTFDESDEVPVALVGAAAASQLGITDIQQQPAIFIDGQAFTVIGIVSSCPRLPELALGITIPASVATLAWGPPSPGGPAQMLIRTRLGAAQAVARQVAVALRPDDPALLAATAPPPPTTLQRAVNASLSALLLVLAAVAVVVGAVGIANTTLVAILERESEIGLRRALGARPIHIVAQFLAESAGLGLLGGLIGTALGILTVLGVTISRNWTAILPAGVVGAAPLAGALIGLLAGLYPALRAASLEPAAALRP